MLKDISLERRAEKMTRSEICDLLLDWFNRGIIISTDKLGIDKNEIERRSNNRELSYTPLNKVMFLGESSDSENFSLFKTLCDNKRIMVPLVAKVEKSLRTLYQLQKAAKSGDLLRFERDGVILYID